MKKKILKFLVNKYAITAIIFLAYIFIFSENNLIKHFRLNREIADFENDKIRLKNTQNPPPDINVLRTQKDSLEKYVREVWNMTRDNEDLFIME